jgi:hypothetical protein
MKATSIIFICIIAAVHSFAQLSPEQRIQDSVIGWWDDPHFDNHLKIDNTPLQKKKIAVADKFVEWMKKSYTPVAGLGTFTRNVGKNNTRVLFLVWNVSFDKMWLDQKGHFKPIDEENTPFRISANVIPASYPISFLNTPSQFYFTWPPDGWGKDNSNRKGMDLKIHPNVYKYITRINEEVTVYLAPNNQLPFKQVTIGQYLDESLASLNKKPQNDDARYRAAIAKWKEKYKDRLNEPAILHDMQPTIIGQFFGDIDPFRISKIEKEANQFYPVYQLDSTTIELCKTEQPQWITVSLPYKTKEDGNQLYEMYTAVTQNINYDYIYNYFYDPEKVKGIAYKPANEELLKARLNSYRKNLADQSNAFNKPSTLPNNVLFMDDFSTNTEGSNPANWFYRKFGKHSSIATVKDQPGKWMQLGAEPVSPILLKKPLPENFTLEYDLATDAAFSSRTGGSASLVLNTRPSNADGTESQINNGYRLFINIESGNEADYNNNNYRGIIKIDINSTPAINTQNFVEGLSATTELREFTNRKNTVHVTVQIKTGVLTVFINNKVMAVSTDLKMAYGGKCISCSIPASAKFNALFWKNTGNDPDNIKTYISNVKISKL